MLRNITFKNITRVSSFANPSRYFTVTTKREKPGQIETTPATDDVLKQSFYHLFDDLENIYCTSHFVVSGLQTLYARKNDVLKKSGSSILNDPFAESIVSTFLQSKKAFPEDHMKSFWLDDLPLKYVAPYRSLLFDNYLKDFLKTHVENNITNNPKNSESSNELNILEIGIGFDFRVERLLHKIETQDIFGDSSDDNINSNNNENTKKKDSNSTIESNKLILNSYELDVSEVIDIREKLIQCNMISNLNDGLLKHSNYISMKRNFLRKSLYDSLWMKSLSDEIDSSKLIIICETSMNSLPPYSMESLLTRLKTYFPNAIFLFDTSLEFTLGEDKNKWDKKVSILQQLSLHKFEQVLQTIPLWYKILCKRRLNDFYNVNVVRFDK